MNSLSLSTRLLRPSNPSTWLKVPFRPTIRYLQIDSRQRRSRFFVPTLRKLAKEEKDADATDLLIRAGYLSKAYAGIFHMLPMGLRVQDKLERLIDKHMTSLGASKVSLSSISSQALWKQSGRLYPGTELLKFNDRKKAEWLLCPTHEEEITTLVKGLVREKKDLPVRLYQIGRKYRDEKRPRGGLLRGKEFLMKDLYTFDVNAETAYSTYEDVRTVYRNFLDELGVEYVEARADSGNMGGNLSHEYHFPSSAGEDNVVTCDTCDYARNEEFVAEKPYVREIMNLDELSKPEEGHSLDNFVQYTAVSKDRRTLVKGFAPKWRASTTEEKQEARSINPYAVKAALDEFADLDTGVEQPQKAFEAKVVAQDAEPTASPLSITYLFDSRVSSSAQSSIIYADRNYIEQHRLTPYTIALSGTSENTQEEESTLNLHRPQTSDPCPSCESGELTVDRAIEIGHTFHLGTRYSEKLNLTIKDASGQEKSVQMGCHGIGVSRLLAAVASCTSDNKGLNWPRVIAPYEVCIITPTEAQDTDGKGKELSLRLYDEIASSSIDGGKQKVDVLLDDRAVESVVYRLTDADIIGYPVVLVLGKSFERDGRIEVQSRRLGVKENMQPKEVVAFVKGLLRSL